MIKIRESFLCFPSKLWLLSTESVKDNREEISIEILRRYFLKVTLRRGKFKKCQAYIK